MKHHFPQNLTIAAFTPEANLIDLSQFSGVLSKVAKQLRETHTHKKVNNPPLEYVFLKAGRNCTDI